MRATATAGSSTRSRRAGLALGRQEAIPLALVVLNLLAVAVGTWAIAKWLRRERFPEWFALLYAAFPGVFFGVWRDLSEPLAYSLTAVALLAFDGERPRRIALSASLFAVAILTREGPPVFALVWAAALALQGRRLRATLFAIGSLVPYLAYQFVFLNQWLGNAGLPEKLQPTPVPFGGIGHYFPWGGVELQRVYAVLLPGCFCVALAVVALVRGQKPRRLGPARERAPLRGVPAGRRLRGLRVGGPDLDERLSCIPAVAAGPEPGVSDDARVDVVADGGMVRSLVRAPTARAGDRLGLTVRASFREGSVHGGGAKTETGRPSPRGIHGHGAPSPGLQLLGALACRLSRTRSAPRAIDSRKKTKP